MSANDVGPFAGALPAPDREEGKPCDDASRPKSDERLTAVFAALGQVARGQGRQDGRQPLVALRPGRVVAGLSLLTIGRGKGAGEGPDELRGHRERR